jgi:hypothetical protein
MSGAIEERRQELAATLTKEELALLVARQEREHAETIARLGKEMNEKLMHAAKNVIDAQNARDAAQAREAALRPEAITERDATIELHARQDEHAYTKKKFEEEIVQLKAQLEAAHASKREAICFVLEQVAKHFELVPHHVPCDSQHNGNKLLSYGHDAAAVVRTFKVNK